MLHTIHRHTPLSTTLTVLFGAILVQIAIAILTFSLIFIAVFVSRETFLAFRFSDSDPAAWGKITAIEGTNSRVNKQRVMAYHYQFTAEGKAFRGISYETRQLYLAQDSAVKIFYIAGTPEVSHIAEMRNSEFPAWIIFLLLIFPVVALLMLFTGLSKNLKALNLLKHGELTKGKLVQSVMTATKINNRHVYKMTFEFKTKEGKMQQMQAQTHLTELLQDEEMEGILYLPNKPAEALTLDEITGCPRIQDQREVLPLPMKKALLYMILPFVLLVEIMLLLNYYFL
jgi:hypothetical protein